MDLSPSPLAADGSVYLCVEDLVLLPSFSLVHVSSVLSESVELSTGHSLLRVGEACLDDVGVECTGLATDCTRTEPIERSRTEVSMALNGRSNRAFPMAAQGVVKKGVDASPLVLSNGLNGLTTICSVCSGDRWLLSLIHI